MNKLFFATIFGITILSSCGNAPEDKTTKKNSEFQYFGDSITETDAIASELLASKMKNIDSLDIKLTGKIIEVCQKKGCWMVMNIGEGKSMRVKFKDYGFFVPKDASGKTIIIEGKAFSETTSVATLQHYAEDAGKSKEEISKITVPETEIGFEAHGVILKK